MARDQTCPSCAPEAGEVVVVLHNPRWPTATFDVGGTHTSRDNRTPEIGG